ncbi:DUF3732 domain-containing protein [Mesorhizobium amorphae]|uniref:DUF3732 domain-containing protein n=1 Tax=Mesorhizobium amorphae TaxID=71433 RepID=UPI003ECDD954
MQIQSVVLYSLDGRINEIPFDLGRVNILTGPSGRGKSALLSVVDYCLGASRFEIPAGVISNSVSWFALKLDFGKERLFVARRSVPVGRTASNEFFVRLNPDHETPPLSDLRPNARRDDLLEKVGSLLGVGVTLLPRADGTAERQKLTFRSGLIYSFQKQNEIANPDLYFHRQSELAQTIRETLPYYLGAISPAIIEKQAELRNKRKRLREVERSLERSVSITANRDTELVSIVAESTRLGLITSSDIPARISAAQILESVSSALQTTLFADSQLTDGQELDLLKQMNTELLNKSRQRFDLKKEIDALERFENDQNIVDSALNEQRRRLTALHLLADDHDSKRCPVCESRLGSVTPAVADMKHSLETLNVELAMVNSDKTDVREQLAKRRAAVTNLTSEIASLRREVQRLRDEEASIKSLLEQKHEVARLSGMIDMFRRLISVNDDETRVALELEKASLATDIEELESETNLSDVRAKTATFLGGIGQQITRWAREQHLEYANGFLTFDLRGPRLVSETADETIPFSRFGSGRNWVWYHLLGHLALHEWFASNKRPVPNFLILDQPSQVYFPSAKGETEDNDWMEVRKIYEWLFDVVEKLDGQMQIIVTDHAKFENDPRFTDHLKHDWWAGGSLVPQDWLDQKLQP